MKHRFILAALFAGLIGVANAQQTTRKVYLVKDNRIVNTYQATDVDYITFSAPQGIYQNITVKEGANTTLSMFNSSDDWDKDPADRKYDNLAGKLVKFMWWADYGFVGSLNITTESGTKVEAQYTEDDEEFGKCWFCVMPDEPIIIETKASEINDYAGCAFVGQYKGFAIQPGSNGVLTATSPNFSLNLSGNTSFHATVSGEKEFAGRYDFDEDNNTFAYMESATADAYGKRTYGVAGKWFEGGDAWVVVNDLNDDRPDNNRYYFVSTTDFTYAAATSDTYGSRYLLEMQRAAGNKYYYYNKLDNTVQLVNVTFSKGTSIAAASEAMITDTDGNPLFRYVRTAETARPTFALKSSEAGIYSPATGTGAQLELDGFGNATYGTLTGTYTVSNGVVTFKPSTGSEQTFVIDTTNHTYTAQAAAEWDGSENYAAAITGRYDNNAASAGMVAITLNHDYSGKEKKGAAKVQATLTTDYYDTKAIVAGTAAYTYDATTKKLTISGLLVGTADGRSTERISIVFDVNDDKTTLTCNEDKLLRAASGGDTRYINLNGLVLTAR